MTAAIECDRMCFILLSISFFDDMVCKFESSASIDTNVVEQVLCKRDGKTLTF